MAAAVTTKRRSETGARLGAAPRLVLIISAVSLLPTLVFGALSLGAGLGAAPSAAAALAVSAVLAFFSVRIVLSGLAAPVARLSSAVKVFIAGDYHLPAVLPKEGWAEAAGLASSLNRLMLELSAFRAFHLNQVVEERAKAQALVETITDGVLLLDDRGQLICSNRMALELLGIGRLDPGMPLPGAVREEAFLPVLGHLLASQEDYLRSEVAVPSRDESYSVVKNFRVISRRFDLATLKKPGRVVVIRDVTAEKEIESARETFFHMITHDMRAPLASIQGYAQMLGLSAPSSPRTEKCLQAIMRSSTRLNGMIEDILNTIKLEKGDMKLRLEDVDAGALCSRVFEVHEPLAARKNISFSSAPPPEKISFRGDPVLLERVLSNLVGNSLKFTPSGGNVRISCRSEASEASEAFFEVLDDGPGIPKEKQAEIFEKYSQLEEHKYMGFGLGLAMCRMAVELHGGRIWVESGEGKGSRFVFTVPRG